MKHSTLIMLMVLICYGAIAQESTDQPSKKWINLIHFESGFTFPNGSISEGLAVRQNISSYYAEQSSQGQISATTTGFNAGFRYELFHPGKRLGISAGLRFSTYTTAITGYSSQNADFFYLRYSSEGVDTKFARVKSITESNKHVGIPLEFKYIPFGFKDVHYYLKAGVEPRYRFRNQIGIEFHDPAMDAYQEDVVAGFSTIISTFTTVVYPAIGIQIGDRNAQGVNIEVLLPSFYLTDENFSLIETRRFSGFRVSYQFPVGN
jgi:hypothetical protein